MRNLISLLSASLLTTLLPLGLWAAAPKVTLSAAATSAKINITTHFLATASSSDGIKSVTFYNADSNVQLGTTEFTAPYEQNLSFATSGTYHVKAIATDKKGVQATSNILNIAITSNLPPVNVAPIISLTADKLSTNIGDKIHLMAAATDSDGIAQVKFYNSDSGVQMGTTELTAPYEQTLLFPIAGTFHIKAIATDTKGAAATSNILSVVIQQTATGAGFPTGSGCNVSQIPSGDRLRIEHGMDTPKWNSALPAAWDDYICKLIAIRTTSIRFAMSIETDSAGNSTQLNIVKKINGTPDSSNNPRADCLAGQSSCPDFGLRQAILAAKRAGMTTFLVYYPRNNSNGGNTGVVKSADQTRATLTAVDLQLRQVPGVSTSARIYDGILIGNEWCGDSRFWDVRCPAWGGASSDLAINTREASRFVDTNIIPALDVLPADLVYVGATWCDQHQPGHLFYAMIKRLQATLGNRNPPRGFGCHSYSADANGVKNNLIEIKKLMTTFKDSLKARLPNYSPRLIVPEWGAGNSNVAMSNTDLTNRLLNAFYEGGADGVYLFATDNSWGAQWSLFDVSESANRMLNFSNFTRYDDYSKALAKQP